MSEEQNINNENEKKETKCKIVFLIVLTIISLLFSVSALVLSIINFKNNTNTPAARQTAPADKNAISRKYDKGRSLEKALATGKPILVFFYTDWCGFCQKFAPTFDKITKEPKIKDSLAIAYVNCEDPKNRQYVEDYNIQGFPTVFVVKKEGNKEQLENNTFFIEKAQETITKNILDKLGIKD